MDSHTFDPVRASTDEELRAHSRWLSAVARALIGDDGDDLAQDAWVAALERKPDAERGLKPWLAGALRFLASNERRTRARRATRERSVARDEALPSSDALAAEIELQRLIADAVSALDEPERSTLVRRYWHGESAAEIARSGGVPAGTVRARLSRALAKLRERLDRRFEGKRDAWCALLTPLAHRDAGLGTGAAAAAGGVWTMSVFVKLASAAAAVALAWILWNVERSDAGSLSASSDVTETATALSKESTRELGAPEAESSARTAAAATPSANAVASADKLLVVLARVIDEHGAPIAGAELVHDWDVLDTRSARARSGSDGRIRLEFEFPAFDAPIDREFLVRADAHTLVELPARVGGGRTVDLGDVVLLPAGEIRGRIVDAEGRPLAGLARAALPELTTDPSADARDGPPAGSRLVAGIAGADGRFVLAAVRAGPCRAWAGSMGAQWSYTPVLTLHAGETLDVGDIVLPRSGATITGHVEGPAGEPLSQYVLAFAHDTTTIAASANSDSKGAFVLTLASAGTFDLLSYSTFGAGPAVFVRDVASGADDVVLRHTPAEFVDVVVRDENGAPVPSYEVRVGLEDTSAHVWSWERTRSDDGRSRVAVWPVPFWIDIEAPGRPHARRGPFDRSAAGTVVEIPLTSATFVRGRVLRHGAPAAGVGVALRELAHEDDVCVANEFPYAFSRLRTEETRSASDGSFALAAPARGRFVVIASDETPLSVQSAVFELDGRKSLEGLELALGAAGALEGRCAKESSATSVWIGISHGDGPTLVARTASDGSFRFTSLAPGRWWIRKLDRDLTGEITTRPRDAAWREPQSFVIADGQTTHVELELAREPGLAGRLRFGVGELGVWTAALETLPAVTNSRTVAVLDEQGGFTFTSGRHGPALLTLTDAETNGVRHEIRAGVELDPGVQMLVFDYDEASVRGRAPRYAGETLAFARVDGKRAFVTRVPVASDGNFGPARTCAGKLVVVKVTREGQLAGDVLLEVELAAGSERTLEVP